MDKLLNCGYGAAEMRGPPAVRTARIADREWSKKGGRSFIWQKIKDMVVVQVSEGGNLTVFGRSGDENLFFFLKDKKVLIFFESSKLFLDHM